MLTVYRRHATKCKYESMSEKRCHCPLWVNGTIDGKLIRLSLKTSQTLVGQKKVREWEAAGKTAGRRGGKCVEKSRRFWRSPSSTWRFGQKVLKELRMGLAAFDGMVRRTLVKIVRGVAVVMAGRVP